jgi:hypothetical protein
MPALPLALVCLSIGLFVYSPAPVAAIKWYVDASVKDSGDGTGWEVAFKTIQLGIDAASDGDIVLVAERVYTENIRFLGKNITVSSTDPDDPTVVANTILDEGNAGPVVTFWGLEGEFCVLSGFTIRNGRAEDGGGIHGRGAHATICNNAIIANCAPDDGGGLYFCDDGGALAYCNGVIESNVIRDNSATDDGG